MKNLLWLIWTILLLVAVVTGCGRAPRYDSRLVAADSLMHDNPDSALAIIQAVAIESLATEADRAYRDLLITQARYKCYITATTDSNINRALAYYQQHSREREKLTRAYIYKGAVMEELGHPDSAMLYYKHAEANAAPDDYFNLGYSKMRIAELYQAQISRDSAAFFRLYGAKKCFELLQDTGYIIVVDGMLGAIHGLHCPDSAKYYLNRAIELSKAFKPEIQYTYKSKLAGVYLYNDKDYEKANKLSMDVLMNGRNQSKENQFYYYAILSFTKLHKLNSAKIILSLTPPPRNASDSILHLDALAEIAKSEGNHPVYGNLVSDNKNQLSSFIDNLQEKELSSAEAQFDKQQILKDNKQLTETTINLYLILLSTFVLLSVLLWLLFMLHRKTKLVQQETLSTQNELKKIRLQINQDNKTVSKIINYRIDALKELYDSMRVKIPDESDRRKKIIPLSSYFALLNQRKELTRITLSDSFWKKMAFSVNAEYKGVLSFVEKKYENLTQDELRIFCLLCSGLSPQIIKHCVNFTNANTVTNYRSIIIKRRMGLDMSFEDFLRKYMNGELE